MSDVNLVIEQGGEYITLNFELAALIRTALDQIKGEGGYGVIRIKVRKNRAFVKREEVDIGNCEIES